MSSRNVAANVTATAVTAGAAVAAAGPVITLSPPPLRFVPPDSRSGRWFSDDVAQSASPSLVSSVSPLSRSARSKFPQSKHEAHSLIPFSARWPPRLRCGVALNRCQYRNRRKSPLFIDCSGDRVKSRDGEREGNCTARRASCERFLINDIRPKAKEGMAAVAVAARVMSKKERKHASQRARRKRERIKGPTE